MRDRIVAREARVIRAADGVAARLAEGDLLPATSTFERIALFEALFASDLPEGVDGLLVRDGAGRTTAWRGRGFAVDASRPVRRSTGTGRTTVHRVLFAESPVPTGESGVAGGVVAHTVWDRSYPLDNEYAREGDFAARAAEELGLARVEVSDAPFRETDEPHRATGVVESAFGGPLVHLAVTIQPVEVHAAILGTMHRSVRGAILAASFLLLTVLAGRAALRPLARPVWIAVFAAAVGAARIGMYLVGFPALLFSGSPFDPSEFSVLTEWFGLETGLLNSPGEMAVSGLAVAAVATVAIVSLARRRGGRLPDEPRPVAGAAVAAAGILLSAGAAALWMLLVHGLVFFSTVEFFSEQAIVPETGASVLLAGLFFVTLSMLATGGAVLAHAARLLAGRRRIVAAAAIGGAAALLFPLLLLVTDLSPALAAGGAACFGAAAGLLAAWRSLGFGLRVAGAAAVVSLFTFPPFIREVWMEKRETVAYETGGAVLAAEEMAADDRFQGEVEEMAADPRLVRALTKDPTRVDERLAFEVWAAGPLSRQARGADVAILEKATKRMLSRFEIDMPPLSWLPEPLPGHLPERAGAWAIDGRNRQRFLVCTAPIFSGDREFLGQLVARSPLERPALGGPYRPPILRSFDGGAFESGGAEIFKSIYDGDRLVRTTNPDYPRVRRAPPDVAREILEAGKPGIWKREAIGGAYWINLYRPRREEGRIAGMVSVGYRSGERSGLLLSFFKLLLLHFFVAVAAATIVGLFGARRFETRFQHRLLFTYLVVTVVPVLLLAQINRSIARETVELRMEATLRQSARLVDGELGDRGVLRKLAEAVKPGTPPQVLGDLVSNERLNEIGYRLGQDINLFLRYVDPGGGARLVASSEPGLFATELFSDRLPGRAWLETVLRGREFVSFRETIGDSTLLVGYTPVSGDGGEVVGAVGLPMFYGQDLLDREVARRNSMILAVYLLVLILVVFIGMLLARRISSPIESLAEATQRLSAGELDYRIPRSSHDELGYLVDSFNRMTDDLRASRERVVKAEKDAAWREMAKQVAHEIKNPLTPMRLSAQHILRAFEDEHEEFREILTRGIDTIIRQTEALTRIAGEFSALARLPAKKPELVDPAAVVREVAGLYQGISELTVHEEIEDVPEVLADPDELRRVIVNLATNAVQAMQGGAGTLTFTVRGDPAGGSAPFVRISVGDTGVGIPPEDMDRLFEPNFSTKTGGTGLGLAISHAVITSFGGTIAVTSTPGEGTTVTLHLPGGGVVPPIATG